MVSLELGGNLRGAGGLSCNVMLLLGNAVSSFKLFSAGAAFVSPPLDIQYLKGGQESGDANFD